MEALRKVESFGAKVEDLKTINLLFIRSQREQSAVVWSSSLTEQNKNDLEIMERSALEIILGSKYESYKRALVKLNLETLEERREYQCSKSYQKCRKNEKTKQKCIR